MSRIWKYALLPLMAAATVLTYTWLQDLEAFRDPKTARILIWHVPMAMLGMTWFWVGAFYGFKFLFGKRQGERALDHRILHANEIGLITTVLATVTGAIFAYRQWGTPWDWDPKQVTIAVLILMYLAYFVLRSVLADGDLRARLSAVYSIVGAVSSIALNYVIPNLEVIASRHPPGNVITGGLHWKWRVVYWMATFAFLGITIWAFQLRLRLSIIQDRLLLGRGASTEGETTRTEAVRKSRLEPAPGEH